jgi:hypothetical protein
LRETSEISSNLLTLSKGMYSELIEREGLSPDSVLDTVRRLDWRFLLPSPVLDRVAYLGLNRGELVKALRIFSDSLTILDEPTTRLNRNEKYTLVVIENPDKEVLVNAGDLVDKRGSLYIEIHGLIGSIKRWPSTMRWMQLWKQGLGFPRGYRELLNRLGYSTINVYWHWPNFKACTRIMPLNDQNSIRYVIDQGGSDIKSTLEKVLGVGMLKTGLLRWMVPYFSLIANRDSA